MTFGDTANQIHFPRAVWDTPPPQANARSYRFYVTQCERLSAVMQAPLSSVAVVRSRLRSTTPMPTLDQLVSTLHLTRRTLQRHRDAEGSSFAVLLTQVRCERAQALLHRRDMHHDDSARVLGFADASAFSRAFKTSTGASPRAFRQQPSDYSHRLRRTD
ncbi:MAG: AraC family transcriptional regulator [Gammaproteobacteria bacterium]|nr:AraC family transcriptional regulator [Gammaproteobacteria bacterium]